MQTLLGKVTGLAKENILFENQMIQPNSAAAMPQLQARSLPLPGAKVKKGAALSAKDVTLVLASGKEEDFERY